MRRLEDRELELIFSDRLSEAMMMRGLEEEDFEDDDIASVSSVRYYQKDNSKLPNLRTAVRIANYLGVSLDWLCGIGENQDQYI